MNHGSVLFSMTQQIKVLDEIDELIKHCKSGGLLDDVGENDISYLRDYSASMRHSCDIVTKLAKNAKAAADAKEEAEKKTEAVEGAKSKVLKKPRASKKPGATVNDEAAPEDELDLDFLS